MLKKLFHKKSVETGKSDKALKPTLGPLQLTSLGIGAIIGAGVFVVVGQAAADFAGPGLILSFLIAAIVCLFTALCYAEFAALIPVSGGVYSYTYVILGELPAWIVGWGVILEFFSSPCTVAIGFSGYVVKFLNDLGVIIPEYLTNSVLGYDAVNGWFLTGSLMNLPAMLIVGGLGILVAFGVKGATLFNNIMVVIKMGLIFLIIAIGVFFIKAENLIPFIPENTGVFGHFGWSGILRAVGVVFFSYIGFDSLATMAQETKDPKKSIPFGMVGSLTVSLIVYVLMALVVTGIVNYKFLSTPYPMTIVINALGPNFSWLVWIVNSCILIALASVILAMLLALGRMTYGISEDGLLPKVFSKISPKRNVPFANSIILTCVAILISGIFPISAMTQLTAMGALVGFAVVCAGVIYLRRTQPKLHRPFKAPLYPVVPIVGLLSCVGLMAVMSKEVWELFGIWMLIGVVIYFSYSVKHSTLRR